MLAIRMAESDADFEQARGLIAHMAAWDVEQTQALGISADDLVSTYYADTSKSLKKKFSGSGGCLLLCSLDGLEGGCAAFSESKDQVVEIQKVFVKPELRGRGAGGALMRALLAEAGRRGCAGARLETVSFMRDAIALYRSFGFVECEPFYKPLEELRAITLFMERKSESLSQG